MTSTTPNKQLGQHWLHDETILAAIADAGNVTKQDHVLEIGPGLGTLTAELASRGAHVIAVEFDEQLARQLAEENTLNNVVVVNQDILHFDLTVLPTNYKVVANIPYYLTGKIIRRLFDSANKPSTIVLLIQKEVAERIVAQPGNMSILSVVAQYYADCSLGTIVPAAKFTPPPKVDSQVVVMHTKADTRDDQQLFRIIKAGFAERRKKLANSLAGGLQIEKPEIEDILQQAFGRNDMRAQELSVDDWLQLKEALDGR